MTIHSIIEARKRLGLSQRQLATKAKISNATVSRYEKGEPVRLEKIKAMQTALGLIDNDASKEALLDENARLRMKLALVKDALGSDE